MSDIDVALDALRSDAKVWDTASQGVSKPGSTVGELTLTGADVSMWAVDAGVDKTYDEARSAVQNLLTQAGENFHNIASALLSAADTYQREEEANQHKIEGTY